MFERAVSADPAQRESLLDAGCGEDADLRREVVSLLDAHGGAGTFLESSLLHMPPLPPSETGPPERQSIWLGRRVGAYRIIRELGRGGMGHVFLAERADALFEKQVAIKIVRLTADADLLVERFKRERQILATLEHPNITRMLDAGMTDDNVPFAVMEYVDGEPIDDYCESHALDRRATLALFCDVCGVVHAAHTRGVIHRDLKPANILVTREGVPKLLDFGIAKIVESQPHDSRTTQTSQRVLTPLTAAPEQLIGGTTTGATDVYALGVLLYRLMAGNYPFHDAAGSSSALEHAIQHSEPQPPSVAMFRSERTTSRIAPLDRRAARDLDRIVLKALRKEPERRHESAEALADDVRRYLEGRFEPVEDTVFERVRTFARGYGRHIAALVVVLALAATWWLGRGRQTEAGTNVSGAVQMLAIQPFRELGTVDTDSRLGWGMADALLTRLNALSELRVRIVDSSRESSAARTSPANAPHVPVGADMIVDGTIQRSDGRLRVTARLTDARLGTAIWTTTLEDSATALFTLQDRLSLDIARRLSPRFDGSGLNARSATTNEQAYEAYIQGRYFLNLATADSVQRALHHFERAAEEDPAFAAAHAGAAASYAWLRELSPLSPPNQSARGRAAAMRALELEPSLGEAHAALGVFMLLDQWDWPAAEKEFRRAIELAPSDAMTSVWYAAGLTAHKRFDEALEHLRRSEARDPFHLPVQSQLVRVLYMARRFDEALRECERLRAADPRFTMWPCALSRLQTGATAEGIAELEGLARRSRRAGTLSALGYAYGRAGRGDDARRIVEEITRLSEEEGCVAYYTAEVTAGLDDRTETLARLDRARRLRCPASLTRVLVDPKFDLLSPEERARLVTPPSVN